MAEDPLMLPLEETSRSSFDVYGNRVGNSCKGIFLGVLLVCGSIGILLWSEGAAVAAHRALDQGYRAWTEIETVDSIQMDKENKLVHVVGYAESSSSSSATAVVARDGRFGVAPTNAVLKLRRYPEMYQWIESEPTGWFRAKYTYSKDWEAGTVESDEFEQDSTHVNPETFPYPRQVFEADPVKLGAFTLSAEVTDHMNWYTKYPEELSVDSIADEDIRKKAHLQEDNSVFFIGNDPSDPAVGDSRIRYEVVVPQTVSIIAKQVGDTLAPFGDDGTKTTILLVESGTHSAKEMFRHAQAAATSHLLMVRVACFLLLYVGLLVLTLPLSVLSNLLPGLDSLTGKGRLATAAVTMIPVALFLTLTFMSLSWVWYRPMLSGSFLILSAVGIYFGGRELGYWGIDAATAELLDEFMELRASLGG